MSVSYVIIHVGPHESFNTFGHKPQKVNGLRDRLLRLGYRVDIRLFDLINVCVIEMCGHEVFRCNIKNLQFNMPDSIDPVCKRAVRAVVKASKKFLRARSYLWSWTLIDEQMFKRSDHAPIDRWPKPVDFKSFDIATCVDCCDLLLFKKTLEEADDERDELEHCDSIGDLVGFDS